MKRKYQNVALAIVLAIATVPVFGRTDPAPAGDLDAQVRHQLLMNPYYNVFDNLGYSVDNSTGVVTLTGDVVWPVVKTDAVQAVKHIPGVAKVVDNIHVLPLSPMDDRIRRAEYRAIFGYSNMYRYAMGPLPSIHIVVANGHVTLTGVVNSQADKDVANIRANGVPGVFSVTNDLRVAEKS